MPPTDALREGERIFTICNACRYCEGYCAVFPAMEQRVRFTPADLHYLANLCHHCGECFHACQYAPPHPFHVNVPETLVQIRKETYGDHAPSKRWLVLLAAAALLFIGARGDGFYSVIPYQGMVTVFSLAAVLVGIAWIAALKRFGFPSSISAVFAAARDTFTLKYLSSDGHGCPYPTEHHSQWRRWFHHLTFYGFLLCLASTSTAAFYHHVLDLEAPYAYTSVPVVLGTLGGIGLLIGPAGLYWLKRPDNTLPVLLFATSLSGLLLLALRETAAMPALLWLHLAVVLALFASMPYGKFVHGLYRFAALVRYAVERPRK